MMFQRPLNPLIGRKRDLSSLAQLLTDADVRLVTVSGAGGIGKTRLVIEVINLVRRDFDNEVVFIDLVPVKSPDYVPERVLSALGAPLPESGSFEDALFHYLENQRFLLVLDNMEHLLAAALFVTRLLEYCPEVVVLTTSRERLGIPAEQLFELSPLEMPDQRGSQSVEAIASIEAVQLFVERAREAERNYELTAENAGDVSAICRRLDGLPLAIELAAARIAEIPPRLILRNFTRILPFLERSAADPEGRHRTMRNAIEWSYRLLNADEQRLFRRLSTFESGCSLAGAVAIGLTDHSDSAQHDEVWPERESGILNMLGSMVAKHFLTRHDWHGNEPRFGMLETIREFGREVLNLEDDAAATRNRHARYAIAMAEEFRGHVQGAEPGRWLDRIEEEISEFRAAFDWLMESGPESAEQALVLSNRLDFFWEWRGHSREGERWISAALNQTNNIDTVERATAYLNLGNLELSELDVSSKFYEKSLAILRRLDHKVGIAGLLNSLGLNAEHRGDFEQASTYLNESLERFSELEYDPGVALCAFQLGTLAGFQGNYQQALDRLDDSRTLYDRLGDVPNALFAMVEMGRFYRMWGKVAEATAILTWALDRLNEANIDRGIRHAKSELGWIAIARGDAEKALPTLLDVIRVSLTASAYDEFLCQAISGIASLAIDAGVAEHGVILLSSVERWQHSAKMKAPVGDQANILTAIENARRSLDHDAFGRAWRLGSLLSIEEAARRALATDVPSDQPSSSVRPANVAKPDYKLTPQERTVLCLIAKGQKNRQIAEELFISERTVAVHVQNILRKLDADNRTHASALAFHSAICPGV